jgi:Family of unknown function (DUF6114)
MFGFVAGLLAELARETGAWLDRILPAPRLRRSLRGWRRRRPFWAAVWVIAGGVETVAIPLAPLPLMIKVGVGAMSAVGISAVLVAGGIFFLVKPEQRMFVSVVTAVASLTSMATTNLGGFGIGMTAGLIGSSLAFGWLPEPEPEREAGTPGSSADGTDADASPPAATTITAAGRTESARGAADSRPEGDEDRARPARPAPRTGRHARRRARMRGAVLLTLSTALAAALPATAGTPAAAAPGTGILPFPWPTFSWPWDTGPGGTTSSPSPSSAPAATATPAGPGSGPGTPSAPAPGPTASAADPSGPAAEGTQVTLPCLTGVDTGGLPDPDIPEAEPGRTPADPGDLTALRPPVVVGGRPGRPRATYPVNTVYPDVGADSLTAYGAIVQGATYLRTADGGRLKVLWVHADRLVADDYTFELRTGGRTQTIDVDLDIPQVDIYVTRLTGSITIPVVGVSTPRICVGADIVPADLPIAVQLPELSVTAVEAGQVLVDAETVGFSDLSARTGRQ